MRKGRSVGQLSIEQRAALFRALFVLGDRIYDFMDQMKRGGFSAFGPREEFYESLAADAEELADHRLYTREWAKWQIVLTATDYDWSGPWVGLCYPEGLRLLDAKRDGLNGVPEAELRQRFPDDHYWRRESDPGRRREHHLQLYAQGRFRELDTAWKERRKQIFASEVGRHATDISQHYAMWSLVIRDRLAFCKAMMKRELPRLGYDFDGRRSNFVRPVYAKRIVPGWDLCFGLQKGDRLVSDAVSGLFDPYLALRAAKDVGDFHGKIALQINYFHLSNAFAAYYAFHSIPELEVVVRAQLYLLQLMTPTIEEALRSALNAMRC